MTSVLASLAVNGNSSDSRRPDFGSIWYVPQIINATYVAAGGIPSPGTATNLSVVPGSPATAGVPMQVTVTALDKQQQYSDRFR
jgi:hypothetical protein